MLVLYRTSDSRAGDRIEERLKELVLSHRIHDIDRISEKPAELTGDELPVLYDDKAVFRGEQYIMAHLEELEQFKQEWDRFQSDACYCEE